MEIQITGHHVSVTPALEQRVHKQLEKLSRYFSNISSLQVILSCNNSSENMQKGKQNHKAEVIVRMPNNEIFAKANADNMYESINLVSKKLGKQVRRYKTKIRSRKGKGAITYEE